MRLRFVKNASNANWLVLKNTECKPKEGTAAVAEYDAAKGKWFLTVVVENGVWEANGHGYPESKELRVNADELEVIA